MREFIVAILIGFNFAFAYDVTSTCKLVKNATYIADPSSCSGWAYCENGEVRGRGNCNQGLNYNVRTGECDYAANVDCRTNFETMCIGLDKVFKSNPNDCNQYCYCSNGKATCLKCPDNQIFNSEIDECIWKDGNEYRCVDNSPCQFVANNQFVKNEKSCSKYYRCLNGRHIEGNCAENQNFNYLQGRCDRAIDYPCSTSSEIPRKIQPTPTSDTCSTSTPSENSSGSFYVKDGKTCRGSFQCNGKNDKNPSWTQCPADTHFNFVKQECGDSVDIHCEYDRCDGLSGQFVAVVGMNCKKFALCRNGAQEPKSERECANKEYPYFDEIAQACVPEKPPYEICKSQ